MNAEAGSRPVTTIPPPGRRRWQRWGIGAAKSLGLLLVFLSSVLVGALIHLDLPAPRKAAAVLVSGLLSDLFEGQIEVENFDHLGVSGLLARNVRVYDEMDTLVLSVESVRGRYRASRILRELFFSGSAPRIIIDHVRLEGARALVVPSDNDVPTLIEAFALRRTPPTDVPSTESPLTVALPIIEIGDLMARGEFGEAPPLHARIQSAHGSLLVTPDGASLDFERFGLHFSGPESLQADGLGNLHVRAPGPLWGHFDGQLGDVPLHLFVRLDGTHLEARAELPHVEPGAARNLVPAWPVHTPVMVRATASGHLPELTTELTARIGPGEILANGKLTLDDGVNADIDIDTQGIDLALIEPSLPSTAIESKGALLLWSDGAHLSAELNGTVQPSKVGGVPVPAIDFRITYDAEGYDIQATAHERGIPAHFDAKISPDGDVNFQARIRRTRLEQAPRLAAWLGARGTVEAEIQGNIRDGQLDSRLNMRSTDLRWRDYELRDAHWSATGRGLLADPSSLRFTGKVRSTDARANALRLATLEAETEGTLEQLTLKVRGHHTDGTEVRGQARVEPTPLVVHDARVSIQRNRVETSARLRRAVIQDHLIQLEGVRIEADGYLEGDVRWSARQRSVRAHGAKLNLGRIAEALGLPRNRLNGQLSAEGQLELGDASSGQMDFSLTNGSIWNVSGIDVSGNVQFDGRQSRGTVSGGLAGLGEVSVNWDGTLAGDPLQARSWTEALGQTQVSLQRVNLGIAGRVLDAPGLADVGGEGYVRVSFARTEKGTLPQALFLAGTQGLSLTFDREEDDSLVFDSLDVSLAGAVEGATGKLAATGRIFDRRGDVMTLSTEIGTDLDAVLRTIAQGNSPWRHFADRPLRAVAIVPYRDLDQLPVSLQPNGYKGRASARAVVTGTLRAPEVHLTMSAHHLTGAKSPFVAPVDGESTLRYALATGKLQGSVRASQNAMPVARGTFDLSLPWQNVLNTPEDKTPIWTGNAQLVLDGLPMELLDFFAERRVRGSAQGSILVTRRGWNPQVRADMNLRRLEIGGANMGEGRLIADTSQDAILMRAHFEDELGSMTTSVRAGVKPTSWALDFSEESPLRLTVESRHYDAAVLSPFVRDTFSELSGLLDGTMQATLEPIKNAKQETQWQAHINGRMRLSGGVFEPAGLGLRLLDTHLVMEARREGDYNVIALNDIRARANSDTPNFRANGMIYLKNLEIEHARFDLEQQAVPFSTGGVRLADLTGIAKAVVEREENEISMRVEIPQMTAELPGMLDRPLIDLEDNPSITVLQTASPPEEQVEVSSGPITPWRIRFQLGEQVRVRNRLLNLRLRGGPEVRVAEETRVSGHIDLVPGGRVTVLGRIFVIEEGRISFDTLDPANPHLDVTATWRAPNGVVVMANVQGTPQAPELSWNSDPGLPGGEAEVIALVLGAGGGESRDGTAGAGLAAAVVNEMLGQVGPKRVEFSVSRDTGAGEGQVASLSERTWDSYTATIQLSDRVWFEGSVLHRQDPGAAFDDRDRGGVSGAIDWRFRPDWSLRTEAGTLGAGVDLLWRYRY